MELRKDNRNRKNVFYQNLIALVFPMAVQNLMTALVSASDALMLGFLNQTALSAVSLAAQYWGKLFVRAVTQNLDLYATP